MLCIRILCFLLLSTAASSIRTGSFIRRSLRRRSAVAASSSTGPLESDIISGKSSVRHFINLTNGIEVLPKLLQQGVPMEHISFFRLQSTHCESCNFEAVLENLDNNLMMHLALGYICILYDFGCRGTGLDDHRKYIPRAFWWGTEWIVHALTYFWNLEGQDEARMVRGYNSKAVFDEQVFKLPKVLRRRLKYFRPYVRTKRLHLYAVYSGTDRDGQREFYADLMKETVDNYNPDMSALRNAAPEDVEEYVREHLVPEGMHIYKEEDFDDLKRTEGYRGRKRLREEADTESNSDTDSFSRISRDVVSSETDRMNSIVVGNSDL